MQPDEYYSKCKCNRILLPNLKIQDIVNLFGDILDYEFKTDNIEPYINGSKWQYKNMVFFRPLSRIYPNTFPAWID